MIFHNDASISRRIELADAANCRRCGQALAEFQPELGAATLDVAGGCAVFAGVGSPMTQAIGMGLDAEVTDADFDSMETFFESRGARIEIETSPHCHPTLRDIYDRRAYRVLEWTNVLCQPLGTVASTPVDGVEIRRASLDEADLWARLLCEGFASDLADFSPTLMLVGSTIFRAASAGYIAYVDGQPVGAGAVFLHDGVAAAMGAATLPAFRRRGVQTALLAARLNFARYEGCDLAYTITAPGSGSQRNAERSGFRVAYTRSKMYKAVHAAG